MKTTGKRIRKTNKNNVKTEEKIGSIYDIIRRPVQKKFNFETIAEYEAFLNNLNLVDLQNHAVLVGLKPGRDRSVLQNTLIKQYAKTKAEQFGATDKAMDNKTTETVLNILARAR